jgi:(p)ppGpp synthase/HD superfamily hydrolase
MPKTDNPILTDRAKRAIDLSFDIHRNQTRKGRGGETPYWNHVSTVAGMVLELKGTEDEYIAALLHDSVEDQAKVMVPIYRDLMGGKVDLSLLDRHTPEEIGHFLINELFGHEVHRLVLALTDKKLPDEIKKLPASEKAPFIRKSREEKIAALRTKNESVRKIKACDALHNARSLLSDYLDGAGPDVWRHFAGGPEGTLWYYETLADVFYELGPARASVELRHVVRRIRAAMKADEGG